MSFSADIEELLGVAQPKRRGRKPGDGGRAATATRDRLNLASAKWTEAKTAALVGELVPVADVEKTWAAILIEVRAGVLAVTDRVRGPLGLTDEQAAVLDRELLDALTALGTPP